MNAELISKLDEIRSLIKEGAETIFKKIDSFLDEESFQTNLTDLQHINEACLILISKASTLLDKDTLTLHLQSPDFATYIANARHDMLNPISVIHGYLEILSEENTKFAPDISYMLSIVNKMVTAIHSTKNEQHQDTF